MLIARGQASRTFLLVYEPTLFLPLNSNRFVILALLSGRCRLLFGPLSLLMSMLATFLVYSALVSLSICLPQKMPRNGTQAGRPRALLLNEGDVVVFLSILASVSSPLVCPLELLRLQNSATFWPGSS